MKQVRLGEVLHHNQDFTSWGQSWDFNKISGSFPLKMPYLKAFAFPRADVRYMYAYVEEGLMCSGDIDHFKSTLCPSTSSFQDFSMVRPLSPPSPISQYLRSSGGRRGIPNMLNVCSLTSSSWALVTSWENREGDQPGTPPTFGVCTHAYICVPGMA